MGVVNNNGVWSYVAETWIGSIDFACGCVRSTIFPVCSSDHACIHDVSIKEECLGCQQEGREAGETQPGRYMLMDPYGRYMEWYLSVETVNEGWLLVRKASP